MKKVLACLALLALLSHAATAWAAPLGVSLGLGQSNDGVDIYRLGLQKDFGATWFLSETGGLSGYFEGSAAFWEKGGEDNTVFAATPVFTYSFNLKSHPAVHPYIEGGIGAAYVSKKVIDGRDLSSHFQFEDRLGVGIDIRGHKLAAQFFHYSNGGIKNPNDGINIWLVSYSFAF